jgi:hypothetical protein
MHHQATRRLLEVKASTMAPSTESSHVHHLRPGRADSPRGGNEAGRHFLTIGAVGSLLKHESLGAKGGAQGSRAAMRVH